MQQLVKCPQCKGLGKYELMSENTKEKYPVLCTLCNGTGKIERGYLLSGRPKMQSINHKPRILRDKD